MSTTTDVHWGRWVAGIAGAVVFVKLLGVALARGLGLAMREAEARGSDVAYVLGMTERHKLGRS